MTLEYRVLAELADGSFCSGNLLAQKMGVSRTAIWKRVRSLEDKGVEIYSVPGKGYRLSTPIELLDKALISQQLANQQSKISQLDICFEVDSTNTRLKDLASQGFSSGHVLLTEYQQHGRGRRGRQWIAPFAGNLTFSLLWRFSAISHSLGGLSLAVAIAIARALDEAGIKGVQLKWPNDLQWQNKKLSGILLEMVGDPTGDCYVIVGVGVNLSINQRIAAQIDQPWTDVFTAAGKSVGRNYLAGLMIKHLVMMMQAYPKTGLKILLDEWHQLDAMLDREVRLVTAQETVQGIAKGVDEDGALLLQRGDAIHRIHSGEVSLRPVTNY